VACATQRPHHAPIPLAWIVVGRGWFPPSPLKCFCRGRRRPPAPPRRSVALNPKRNALTYQMLGRTCIHYVKTVNSPAWHGPITFFWHWLLCRRGCGLTGVGKEGHSPSLCAFLVVCWRLRHHHTTKKDTVWGRRSRPQTPTLGSDTYHCQGGVGEPASVPPLEGCGGEAPRWNNIKSALIVCLRWSCGGEAPRKSASEGEAPQSNRIHYGEKMRSR
jgi:hypothetical protein